MKNRTIRRLAMALAACAAISAAPASALTINLIDVGGVTGSPAEQGFSIAAKYWESVFTNDAVVNFEVGYESLGPDVLGQTGSTLFTYVPISTYYTLLGLTGTSGLDATAVAHLSPLTATDSVRLMVPSYLDPLAKAGIDDTGPGRLAPDGTEISQTLALTSANTKALIGGFEDMIDGHVAFSSDFAFDFNPSDGIAPGTYDFIGVAIHEIGHALGFVSGADDFDYSDGYAFGDVDEAWWAYGLDMFRYAKQPNMPGALLNIIPGDDAYFSIDGGATAYLGAHFSTGTNFGDGWQASHWKAPGDCGVFVGIMNPYICGGKGDEVTAADVGLFDAIGWNLADGIRDNTGYKASTKDIYLMFAPVPEPSTWVQMAIGFGLFGLVMRRRMRTSVSFS